MSCPRCITYQQKPHILPFSRNSAVTGLAERLPTEFGKDVLDNVTVAHELKAIFGVGELPRRLRGIIHVERPFRVDGQGCRQCQYDSAFLAP